MKAHLRLHKLLLLLLWGPWSSHAAEPPACSSTAGIEPTRTPMSAFQRIKPGSTRTEVTHSLGQPSCLSGFGIAYDVYLLPDGRRIWVGYPDGIARWAFVADAAGSREWLFGRGQEEDQRALKAFDLTKIRALSGKGRVQDQPGLAQDRQIVAILGLGKDAIPILIEAIGSERPYETPPAPFWPSMVEGDVALVVLSDLFLDPSSKRSTLPELCWDRLLGRSSPDASAWELLDRYVKSRGRASLVDHWRDAWLQHGPSTSWDPDGRYFKVAGRELKDCVTPASLATHRKDTMSYAPAEIYTKLRQQALTAKAEALRLPGEVYGVIMETGYPDAVVTLVALADGTASLYFSNGGGMIGMGQHPGPAEAARSLVSSAVQHRQRLGRTTETPLPRPGHTRFFVLTRQGILTAEAKEEDLGENRHALSPLFYSAHELIAEMRKVDQRKK
jgi:hypothetical protein